MEIGKFEVGNKDFLNIKKHCYNLMGLFNTSTRVFDGLMYLTVIVGGGLFLVYGKILPGDMVAYVMYVSTLSHNPQNYRVCRAVSARYDGY